MVSPERETVQIMSTDILPTASFSNIAEYDCASTSPETCNSRPGLKSGRKELSVNKKTYHKLAEQSRRHRLNNAIRELETLIPASLSEEKTKALAQFKLVSGAKTKSGTKEQTKADVVELGINYIKILRSHLDEETEKLRKLDTVLLEKSA